ncbi:hypothetical protein, partial [Flavobacterium gawalongense]|uniref:hypothetical protein n=1 Tax=Flavobacterium gawalongense TaxID=2594432 RepID=UPI001F34B03A
VQNPFNPCYLCAIFYPLEHIADCHKKIYGILTLKRARKNEKAAPLKMNYLEKCCVNAVENLDLITF